jgi:hypothetical protein
MHDTILAWVAPLMLATLGWKTRFMDRYVTGGVWIVSARLVRSVPGSEISAVVSDVTWLVRATLAAGFPLDAAHLALLSHASEPVEALEVMWKCSGRVQTNWLRIPPEHLSRRVCLHDLLPHKDHTRETPFFVDVTWNLGIETLDGNSHLIRAIGPNNNFHAHITRIRPCDIAVLLPKGSPQFSLWTLDDVCLQMHEPAVLGVNMNTNE